MGTEREEKLEVCMQLGGHDLPAITKMWQHSSHNRATVTAGHRLFRKIGVGWWGGKGTFVWENSKDTWSSGLGWAICPLSASGSQIGGQANTDGIVAGVCYSLPAQIKIDETLFIQLKQPHVYRSLALTGIFNYPTVSWNRSTAGNMKPRRFLESIDDNVLKGDTEEPTRAGTLLNLILTNKLKLGSDVNVRSSYSCTDRDTGQHKIPRGRNSRVRRVETLDLHRLWPVQTAMPWSEGSASTGHSRCAAASAGPPPQQTHGRDFGKGPQGWWAHQSISCPHCINKEIGNIVTKETHLAKYQFFLTSSDDL